MRKTASMVLSIVGMAAIAHAQMQPVVNGPDGKGGIDWNDRTIISTGIGAPNPDLPEAAQRGGAERAAQMIALRNALETIKGITLTGSTTVENYITKNDQVTTSINGFVKGFQQQGRTKYMSDGSVEITMKIPLDGIGGLGEKLMDPSISDKPSAVFVDSKRNKPATVFSGLIIDCTGLKIKPALSPRILDESGKEVYGSAYVTREWAVKYGIVGYARDVASAAKLERVGTMPGSIKGLRALGDNSTDVIISNADASDVRSAAENLKFLSECRVILVVN